MTREQLIKNGVRNLKEFGYPDCNEESKLKVHVFKSFFISMLNDNFGIDKQTDKVIRNLLNELK